MFREIARAKINLTLHVGAAIKSGRYKGYHPLDSLVVFADIGDDLSYDPSYELKGECGLSIDGPFGTGLECDDGNLILRAALAFFAKLQENEHGRKGHFHLTKNLPLASGIGGGSADAAAALCLLEQYYQSGMDLYKLAEKIGADVPVCLASETMRVQGIGEQLTPMPELDSIPALLVNPGFGVSTKEIFTRFDLNERPIHPQGQSGDDLLSITQNGRNDLQDVAMSLRPEIGSLIDELSGLDGVILSRMSGSGATCFTLFETEPQSRAAAELIKSSNPDYWCVATLLGK